MQNQTEKVAHIQDIFERREFDDKTCEFLFYVTTRFPAPFKDRDCVFYYRSVITGPGKVLLVRFSVTHSKYPPTKKYVRMRVPVCFTLLEEEGNGTYFTQVIESNLGGNMPSFASKFAASSLKNAGILVRGMIDRIQISNGKLSSEDAKSFAYPHVRRPQDYVE